MTESKEQNESSKEDGVVVEEEATEASALSEMDQLQLALAEKTQAEKEAQERYLRTLADLGNYKKRTQKDQAEQAKFANERLVTEILPVMDNLERAILHSKESSDFKNMLEGVTMIQKQLLTVLDKFGVKPIESLDQSFDPFYHQSVGQVDIEEGSEVQDNQVVTEAQKGYFLKDRVLRPSLVIVAKKKETPPTEGSIDTTA